MFLNPRGVYMAAAVSPHTPPPDRHKPSRMVRLPKAMADLVDGVARNKMTDLTTEVKQAIREYLERLGRWPSSDPS